MPSRFFSLFPVRRKVPNSDLQAAGPQAISFLCQLSSVSSPSGKGSLIERFFQESVWQSLLRESNQPFCRAEHIVVVPILAKPLDFGEKFIDAEAQRTDVWIGVVCVDHNTREPQLL